MGVLCRGGTGCLQEKGAPIFFGPVIRKQTAPWKDAGFEGRDVNRENMPPKASMGRLEGVEFTGDAKQAMDQSAPVAMTKYHRRGSSDNRHLFSHNSRAWKVRDQGTSRVSSS